MEHQNWDYTVLTAGKGGSSKGGEKTLSAAMKDGKDVESVKKAHPSNKKGPGGSEIHKILESDNMKVEHVSVEFKIALQQARAAKNLTQKELAQLVNEKQSVISDYESGKAIPDTGIIFKLEKALGVKLPKEKKKKAKKEDDETD